MASTYDDYGTIKIPREEYERHNERRQDMGLTWAEYIDGEAADFEFDVDLPADFEQMTPDEYREIVREEVRRALEELQR